MQARRYTINGKAYSEEAKVSPFSLIQSVAGEFTINSIAHQQKMCKAVVTDLRINVHPLPSAQVGHGKRIYQDIHEGDQAEILFTLDGTPPFSFTYQRAEPSVKKGGKPGKVLETHTVSRVTTHEYSVFSGMEGKCKGRQRPWLENLASIQVLGRLLLLQIDTAGIPTLKPMRRSNGARQCALYNL
jgi:hypothetical protein